MPVYTHQSIHNHIVVVLDEFLKLYDKRYNASDGENQTQVSEDHLPETWP